MKPTVTSDKNAKIELVTGAVTGAIYRQVVPIGPVLVPLLPRELPKAQFSADDQRECIEVLKSELLRLKVFQKIYTGADAERVDMTITVTFAYTHHELSIQETNLVVVMNIKGGKDPFERLYHVNSNEGASESEKWNTNAYEAKVKAVRRLLEKLVPDIQQYLASNA